MGGFGAADQCRASYCFAVLYFVVKVASLQIARIQRSTKDFRSRRMRRLGVLDQCRASYFFAILRLDAKLQRSTRHDTDPAPQDASSGDS
jgi:hypothetical protein